MIGVGIIYDALLVYLVTIIWYFLSFFRVLFFFGRGNVFYNITNNY